MEKFFKKVSELRDVSDKKLEKNRFNVITALHKERDEVYLHSRMISYLLSPTSGHGMKDQYLHLFIREVLKLESEKFDLSKVEVRPNEYCKSEYKDIDLLIVNKFRSQAIIIENKIDAKDSNNSANRDGYKGQLERYYNTIKLGKDKNEVECKEYHCNHVYAYYLSLHRNPSECSIGVLSQKPESWSQQNILSYDTHIRQWLTKCIKNTPEEKFQVKNFIQHYSNLIDRLTHNNLTMDEIIKLKDIVANNIDDTQYLIENFKHVKWHTAHEFWTELKSCLESQFHHVSFFSEENADFKNAIAVVTHKNKDINHGIVFNIGDKKAYISGLGKLSWGIEEPKKWSNFKNESIEDINFSDFSSKSTYYLIDKAKMKNAVTIILEEIEESIKCNFETLKSE